MTNGNSIKIVVDNVFIEIFPDEVSIESIPVEGYSVMEGDGIIVGINTELDEELSVEGLARDIVRRIQSLRKEANFDINDHIEIYYRADPELGEVFQEELEYIKEETLAEKIIEGVPPQGAKTEEYKIESLQLTISLINLR